MKRNFNTFASMNIPYYYTTLSNSIKANITHDFITISTSNGDDIDADEMILYFDQLLNGYVYNTYKDSVSIEYYYNDNLYKITLYYNQRLDIYKLSYTKIN